MFVLERIAVDKNDIRIKVRDLSAEKKGFRQSD